MEARSRYGEQLGADGKHADPGPERRLSLRSSQGLAVPRAIAVTPDGQSAYIVDEFNSVVFPVDDLGARTRCMSIPAGG
jgi:6-phosphogluconolactonase (cycloisomerase 2 family)